MITFFIMSVAMCVLFLVIATASQGGDARSKTLRNGTDARGIILWADKTATNTTLGGVRYETRQIVLDIEVPGKAPYELSFSPLIPRVCEALPGSSLDLRVDPANPNNVAIIGPVGSIGWMTAMPALFPQVQTAGCLKPVGVVFLLPFVAIFGFLSFVGGKGESAPSAPSKSTESSHPATTSHEICEAAARCCAKIGPSSGCKSFKTMSESACKTVLDAERKAAAKLKKVCE